MLCYHPLAATNIGLGTPELVRNARFGPRPAAIGLGVGQSDLRGSRTSGGLWKRLGGGPREARKTLKGPKSRQILIVFWLQMGTPGPPAPREVLQEGSRDVPAKTGLGSLPLHLRRRPRQGAMVAAVAQLYLGSMTFFAAREGSFGLRVAVVEPSAKTLGFRVLGFRVLVFRVLGFRA